MNTDDWEKSGGLTCSECGQEAFRLFKGMCLKCSREKQRIKDINRLSRKAVSLSRRGRPMPDELMALGQALQDEK